MPGLRKNRVKDKLSSGQSAIILSGQGPDCIEGLGPLDVVDGIWIDMEHGPVTWADLAGLSRACDLWGMTSMVRVCDNQPWMIGRALDQGVQGVVVPHVSTKREAEQVVRAAKYAPTGMRGVGSPSRQGYGVPDFRLKVNDETLVVVMIEEVEAIDNLPEILTVDHIDCFFVAPSDLSQTMGAPYLGSPGHPDVQAMVDKAIKEIVAAGRVTGTLANDGSVERLLGLRAQFLLTSTRPYVEAGLRGFQAKVASNS